MITGRALMQEHAEEENVPANSANSNSSDSSMNPSGTESSEEEDKGRIAKAVRENRMITVRESQLRYAGAAVILAYGIYKYVGMQAAGVFNYNSIASITAGAWILFETGRQSI